jgi:hypothetical protein
MIRHSVLDLDRASAIPRLIRLSPMTASPTRRFILTRPPAGVHLDIPDLMMKMKDDGLAVHCFTEPCY